MFKTIWNKITGKTRKESEKKRADDHRCRISEANERFQARIDEIDRRDQERRAGLQLSCPAHARLKKMDSATSD